MLRLSTRRRLRWKYTAMTVGYFFLFLVVDTFVQALWHRYRGVPFEALPATEWAVLAMVAAAVSMGSLAVEMERRIEAARTGEVSAPSGPGRP